MTIILNNPDDSILISLTPLEIHKNEFRKKNLLEYGIVLKKAIEKFKKYEGSESPDPVQRKLVYCKITSSVDSTINGLFESYMHMNVNNYALQGEQSDIARYASTKDFIPGLSENRLEFKIDHFTFLPMFIERYINRSGSFVQNGNQIAVVGVDLGETKNVYYINVADTSIVYITSQFKSKRKNQIQGLLPAWQDDRSSSTEISFSRDIENRDIYLIDCISENENFRIIRKNKPDQAISKSTLFSVVPDSSLIYNAVRDHVLHETLTLVKVMNNNIVAVENVYVETDRCDYMSGDTIWFSAFVLDNLHMDSTSLSKILYTDLINADNKLEKQGFHFIIPI